jgi:hypothetical protein
VFKVALPLILVLTLASSASAQTGKHLSLGAGLALHQYLEDDEFSSKNPSLAILYRFSLHPEKQTDGWKYFDPSVSVGWSKADVDQEVGGAERRLGKLRSIPVLVGGGPSYRRGPMKVGASLVGGVAFNKFTIDDATRTTLAGLGQNLTEVETKNAFAMRIGVSTWYDLSSRLGLHGSVAYLYSRPKTDVTLDGVTTTDEWKTDKLKVTGGFAVGIF